MNDCWPPGRRLACGTWLLTRVTEAEEAEMRRVIEEVINTYGVLPEEESGEADS